MSSSLALGLTQASFLSDNWLGRCKITSLIKKLVQRPLSVRPAKSARPSVLAAPQVIPHSKRRPHRPISSTPSCVRQISLRSEMAGLTCRFGNKDAQAKLALWFPPPPKPAVKPLQSPEIAGPSTPHANTGPVPLTKAVLRDKRQERLWCVVDETGGYVLTVTDEDGAPILIHCAFVPSEEIQYVVNYQKRKFATVPEDNKTIAVNFLDLTKGKDKCWVDALNHLNDEELKRQVEEEMSNMLRTHKVVAEYFAYQGG